MSDVRLLSYVYKGMSPVVALDYYMVEDAGLEATTWADARNVTPRTVEKNADEAASYLGVD